MSLKLLGPVIALVMLFGALGDGVSTMVVAAQEALEKTSQVADCANARQAALVELVDGLEDTTAAPEPVYPYTFVDVPLPQEASVDSVSFEPRSLCGETVQHTIVSFTDGSNAVIAAPAVLLRLDDGVALFRAG